jgi:hypothetical protein
MSNTKEMKSLSSSLVRTRLFSTLREIWEDEIPLAIKSDGKISAILSLEKPKSGTPPLRIKTKEARSNWSELLDLVKVYEAKYYFQVRFKKDDDDDSDDDGESVKIYLTRAPEYKNKFQYEWQEHNLKHGKFCKPSDLKNRIDELGDELRENISSDVIEIFDEAAQKISDEINRRISLAFAMISNNGNLQATPGLGIKPLSKNDDI